MLSLSSFSFFLLIFSRNRHQSFPIACTSSPGPWKNTLTILLQPVEFD
jgi:hypothetical protein